MEKIEIKDFAGIKDITIEVKQINILIGPQASGKSIIAKLLYYFKNFIFEIVNGVKESKNANEIKKDYIYKFKDFFPLSSWGDQNFILLYYIDEEFIEVSRKKEKTNTIASEIIIKYSGFYRKLLNKLREFKNKYD